VNKFKYLILLKIQSHFQAPYKFTFICLNATQLDYKTHTISLHIMIFLLIIAEISIN